MRTLPASALSLAFVAGLSAATTAAQEPRDEPSGEVGRLFADNCASCHGKDGDGQGWVALDRQARSFRDGGFSFGNTPEALLRTITHGIPGTPMPGFDASLGVEARRALAGYVASLGPETKDVESEDTVLVVGERPAVVRGLLPPIAEGAPSRPRGLLVGTPDGMSFEYRTDDVRLLGVRQGGFVERSDWIGRGGTALEPLGRVVYLVEDGAPLALFYRSAPGGEAAGAFAEPLAAHLAGTWIRGSQAGVVYDLRPEPAEPGPPLARVRESARALGTSVGSGFARHFRVTPARATAVAARLVALGEGDAPLHLWLGAGGRTTTWVAIRRSTGTVECLGLRMSGGGLDVSLPDAGGSAGALELRLELDPVAECSFELLTVVMSEWSEDARRRLAEETQP